MPNVFKTNTSFIVRAIPWSTTGKRRARNGLRLGVVPPRNGPAQFFRAFAIVFQRARSWKLRPASGGGRTFSRITATSYGPLISRVNASKRVASGSRLSRTCIVSWMTAARCRWFRTVQSILFLVSILSFTRTGKSLKRTCANWERNWKSAAKVSFIIPILASTLTLHANGFPRFSLNRWLRQRSSIGRIIETRAWRPSYFARCARSTGCIALVRSLLTGAAGAWSIACRCSSEAIQRSKLVRR